MRCPSAFLLSSALALLSARVLAQAPLGGEFRVNTYTTSAQRIPLIASDTAGNFVVTWLGKAQEGGPSSYGVYAQRYSSAGTPRGAEFHVNSYTTGDQTVGGIASDASGNFVIVWNSALQDGVSGGIFGRRFASGGGALGSEFRINTYTTSNQGAPRVAVVADGRFVVVWSSLGQDGDGYGCFGQRYSSSGSPLGGEFAINSYTTGLQIAAAVVSDPSGGFVVAWAGIGSTDASTYGVFARRYASTGAPAGAEFRVNTFTTGPQGLGAAAMDGAGNFVVIWASSQDGGGYGVFGQRYASDGSPRGDEFQVNTTTANSQNRAAVASDSFGGFVVAWESTYQDSPTSRGIFAQRFDSTGAPAGPEFRVNTYTTYNQADSAVAADARGGFVVTWGSATQDDGSNYGVYAQRYSCDALTSVSIGVSGSTSVCTGGTAGTATVTDTGGVGNTHSWAFRTSVMPMGSYTPIPGETGSTYLIKYSDFGSPGFYFLVCATSTQCGTLTFSNEVGITVSGDAMSPTVTAPAASAVTQTLCQ